MGQNDRDSEFARSMVCKVSGVTMDDIGSFFEEIGFSLDFRSEQANSNKIN